MTKFEFLTKSDFNNLSLSEQIDTIIQIADGYYQTLSDKKDSEVLISCDEDGTPNPKGKYQKCNLELKEAHDFLLKSFPQFEIISKTLRKHKFEKNETYRELKAIFRDKTIDKII